MNYILNYRFLYDDLNFSKIYYSKVQVDFWFQLWIDISLIFLYINSILFQTYLSSPLESFEGSIENHST